MLQSVSVTILGTVHQHTDIYGHHSYLGPSILPETRPCFLLGYCSVSKMAICWMLIPLIPVLVHILLMAFSSHEGLVTSIRARQPVSYSISRGSESTVGRRHGLFTGFWMRGRKSNWHNLYLCCRCSIRRQPKSVALCFVWAQYGQCRDVKCRSCSCRIRQ